MSKIDKVDRCFLELLGVICILYSVYHSPFAEIHIRLPWLGVPVFIGEMTLILCWIWLVGRWGLLGFLRNRYGWLLVVYIGWVIFKALKGSIEYGPLALRNAALFYYPLYAVFVFMVVKNQRVHQKEVGLVFVLLILLLNLFHHNSYFSYVFVLLCVSCLLSMKKREFRIAGIGLLLLTLLMSDIFKGGRAFLLGVYVSSLFFVVAFVSMKLRKGKQIKQILVLIIPLVFLLIVVGYSTRRKILSMVAVDTWIAEYKKSDQIVQNRKDTFDVKDIEPQLYNSDKEVADRRAERLLITRRLKPARDKALYDGRVGNILFRLFVWRDMLKDLSVRRQGMTGVSFGKPLRSMSIEILNIAGGEWSRDGWIMPHNAFLHMIYRGGMVGLFLVAGIWGAWFWMAYCFIAYRSLRGVILCSILLYWLVVAGFSVTLELPYHAIPFWSLWGLTWAYCVMQSNDVRLQNQSQSTAR